MCTRLFCLETCHVMSPSRQRLSSYPHAHIECISLQHFCSLWDVITSVSVAVSIWLIVELDFLSPLSGVFPLAKLSVGYVFYKNV